MPLTEIGCCGAYCGTCPVLQDKTCKGCKIGYDDGSRDLSKAKCRMKVCCMQHGLISCADCPDYMTCADLQTFYGKNGYKYDKYRQATAFIRENGYNAFLKAARQWTRAYGKYPK